MGRIREDRIELGPQAKLEAGSCWEDDAALAAALAAVLVEYRTELARRSSADGTRAARERWQLVRCWEQSRGVQ